MANKIVLLYFYFNKYEKKSLLILMCSVSNNLNCLSYPPVPIFTIFNSAGENLVCCFPLAMATERLRGKTAQSFV